MDSSLKLSSILERCSQQMIVLREFIRNYDNQKLQREWNYLINSLIIASEELKSHGTCDTIKIINNRFSDQSKNSSKIAKDVEIIENELERIKNLLDKNTHEFNEQLQNLDLRISSQFGEIDDVKIKQQSERKFEDEWSKAIIEENNLRCEIEEHDSLKRISDLEKCIQNEGDATNALQLYYIEEKKVIKELTETWKNKFIEIDNQQKQYELLDEERKSQFEELQTYRNLFDSRKIQIDEYLSDKEQRRLEQEHQLYLNETATKIQAWWRGVMVRRGLGPYKHLLKARQQMRKRKMSLKKISKK